MYVMLSHLLPGMVTAYILPTATKPHLSGVRWVIVLHALFCVAAYPMHVRCTLELTLPTANKPHEPPHLPLLPVAPATPAASPCGCLCTSFPGRLIFHWLFDQDAQDQFNLTTVWEMLVNGEESEKWSRICIRDRIISHHQKLTTSSHW